jgi:copper chaperone
MSQKFQVTGMSCNHCIIAVQNAVQAVDPKAQVTVDLETGHVDVLSPQPREDLRLAIENAGYGVQ